MTFYHTPRSVPLLSHHQRSFLLHTGGRELCVCVCVCVHADGNKHRAPQSDIRQRVRDLGMLSPQWVSPSNPSSQGSGNPVEKETVCQNQRRWRTPGEQGPLINTRLRQHAQGLHRSAPGPLHAYYLWLPVQCFYGTPECVNTWVSVSHVFFLSSSPFVCCVVQF